MGRDNFCTDLQIRRERFAKEGGGVTPPLPPPINKNSLDFKVLLLIHNTLQRLFYYVPSSFITAKFAQRELIFPQIRTL